ncbi:hypothetical protein [Paenarthrobacter nitroguajacolicus]|nr:hypothetical protein [Paenarthrobacter nitroguajacolicus]MDI2032968.1 hypothetical protein [Paenarthrobacter nitroguajacolicus]
MKKSPFTPKEQELVNRQLERIRKAGYPPLSAAQAQVIRRTYGRLVAE